MDIEDINKMWANDCKIDELNLGGEAAKIPQLHSKYYRLYISSSLKVKKLRADLTMLEKAKFEYYNGSMSEEELKDRGWKPNPLKIIRTDINRYIDSDKDIVSLSLNIDYHLSIANYIEDILRQINARNYMISNAINWAKFQQGIN